MAKKIRPRDFKHACVLTNRNPKAILPYAKPKNDFQEALNAIAMLWVIGDAIRAGWIPDYDNSNQEKWYPRFYKERSGFVFSFSYYDWAGADAYSGSRLCFENSSDAEYFGKKFIKLHNKVLCISKK